MKVLVIGGAGYIGSHMVKLLGDQGCNVTTLDDLSSGYEDAVLCGKLIKGNFGDLDILEKVLSDGFDAVMHFASFIQVGESIEQPDKYYRNNVIYTLGLLDMMRKHGVSKFIFSSTAAIFGEPQYSPIDEKHPKLPINPYGRTKGIVEQVLSDYDRAYGLKSVSLRYFNAAGADKDCLLGERHEPETHLIPLILQVAAGRRPYISVYGSDYETPDGTCIRDYIHIEDLCNAHWLSLNALLNDAKSKTYNLGNGSGFSVKEVIDAAVTVTGCNIPITYAPRRDGDPARLIADSRLAQKELGWEPVYTGLKEIIDHAWRWEQGAHFP